LCPLPLQKHVDSQFFGSRGIPDNARDDASDASILGPEKGSEIEPGVVQARLNYTFVQSIHAVRTPDGVFL
jgi:hypothetical protein